MDGIGQIFVILQLQNYCKVRNPDRETIFRFKKFDVVNRFSAMKVGTDGVLLGAWAFMQYADNSRPMRILDVGTGSGVIALMLAQRFEKAYVTGVEIDSEAAEEANRNFCESPWPTRLLAVTEDFNTFVKNQAGKNWDLIVSNPPYYNNGEEAPDEARRRARHEKSLGFATLINKAELLLSDSGLLAVVAPWEMADEIAFMASLKKLRIVRKCDVRTVSRKNPRRVLLEFEKVSDESKNVSPVISELRIHNDDGSYSSDYIKLTQDFYLKF